MRVDYDHQVEQEIVEEVIEPRALTGALAGLASFVAGCRIVVADCRTD
jgi:hypothetical protein